MEGKMFQNLFYRQMTGNSNCRNSEKERDGGRWGGWRKEMRSEFENFLEFPSSQLLHRRKFQKIFFRSILFYSFFFLFSVPSFLPTSARLKVLHQPKLSLSLPIYLSIHIYMSIYQSFYFLSPSFIDVSLALSVTYTLFCFRSSTL